MLFLLLFISERVNVLLLCLDAVVGVPDVFGGRGVHGKIRCCVGYKNKVKMCGSGLCSRKALRGLHCVLEAKIPRRMEAKSLA